MGMLRETIQTVWAPVAGDPLLVLVAILIAGSLFGALARRIHLPSITGNVLAGILIGPVLHLFEGQAVVDMMSPLSTFAMGMIAVTVGGHLSYRRIHNAVRRIAWIGLLEAFCALGFVVGAMRLAGANWPTALMLGALATESAAATTIHVIREKRGKGPFVRTVLSVVAVDNITAIILFAVVSTILVVSFGETHTAAALTWLIPVWNVLGAVVLGLLIGRGIEVLDRFLHIHKFSIVFFAVLMSVGLSPLIGANPLLTSLVFGVYLANRSRGTEEDLNALEPITPLLFVCFFTLAGMTLHLDALVHGGILGLLYVVARVAGKTVGGALGGIASRTPARLWSNTGLALMPQAGLTIALVVLLQADERLPLVLRTEVSTLVLAAVVINEIIGPLSTGFALRRTREDHKDRRRLIEFIEEEFIKTGMTGGDKWEIIRELCEFLILTHGVEHTDADELYRTVVERENVETTALGLGAALPHGRMNKGPEIQGVLGIVPDGVEWYAPDGQPVRIVMLIVTPADHNTQHLQVMAALATMLSHESTRQRLAHAQTPIEAWETIEDKETPDFNYFLED